MLINTDKTKIMLFNYTKNHQFTTRVSINNLYIEVVSEAKHLVTYITNDLNWDVNTQNQVKNLNARM